MEKSIAGAGTHVLYNNTYWTKCVRLLFSFRRLDTEAASVFQNVEKSRQFILQGVLCFI